MSTVRTGRGVSGPRGTTRVEVDGKVVGYAERSDRRWARGYKVSLPDGKDLGDQPRLSDAVMFLESYATSPLREASPLAADLASPTKAEQDRLEAALARADVQVAEAALRNATEPYERAHRAYREAERNLSQAKLREADVLDRQAIERGNP